MEVKSFRLGAFRWPSRVLPPHIRPGLEDISFGKFGVALALQVLLKEWEENIFPIILGGIRGKAYSSQGSSLIAGPTAMDPGSDNKGIKYPGIILVDGVKCGEGTLQILGVEPSSDGQHGAMD